jgi:hypothetical protein
LVCRARSSVRRSRFAELGAPSSIRLARSVELGSALLVQ